ncbi:ABC transporter permease [Zoogloea sp.]|uniref:ABC transporter permease n=1 Tax=Zoogloea sp. TaxID=49181 RepID=UPI0035B4E353
MNATFRIAREEWRLLWRDQVAVTGLVLLLLLTVMSALTAWEQRQVADAERARYQTQVNHEFESQPDRHPHRMVHYGQFAFRTLNPLAAFDSGIDPYTGHTLYLEGHRQNSANFGEVRQSSLMLRFGQLTPAFVLQVLAPLILVFIGHAAVARERETGTLRLLVSQGLPLGRLVLGKLLVLAGVAALALTPAVLALLGMILMSSADIRLGFLLIGSYGVWLSLWACTVVGVSALVSRGRDALIVLLSVWVFAVVLIPRFGADLVAWLQPLPTRFETDLAVSRDLAALGDSHNPNDPYFNSFREKVLAQYGVSRIEDLPVNYKGLLGMEGERLTSELFSRYAADSFAAQEQQQRYADAFSLISPLLALRRVSMIASGTDLHAYRLFLEQAEHHRYALVQQLNRLQAEKLNFSTDRSSLDNRIGHEHWRNIAEFRYAAETSSEMLHRALPMTGVLLIWLLATGGLMVMACRRLGRMSV